MSYEQYYPYKNFSCIKPWGESCYVGCFLSLFPPPKLVKQEPMVENEKKQSKLRRKAGSDPRGEVYKKQGESNLSNYTFVRRQFRKVATKLRIGIFMWIGEWWSKPECDKWRSVWAWRKRKYLSLQEICSWAPVLNLGCTLESPGKHLKKYWCLGCIPESLVQWPFEGTCFAYFPFKMKTNWIAYSPNVSSQ